MLNGQLFAYLNKGALSRYEYDRLYLRIMNSFF